jgi:phosphohistidine phosphatase
MQVYLLRHGIAEDGAAQTSDSDRALTSDGRRKLRQVLAHVADSGVKVDLILTSPLKRAVQTAEVATSCLRPKPETSISKALAPDGTVEDVWSEIRAHRDAEVLLLVGHNPLFSNLAAFLLGAPELQVDFKKGAVMRIDLDTLGPKPHGALHWYLTARLAGMCE